MSSALRILHLSDTHLFGDDTLHYGMVDTLAATRRVLEHAGRMRDVDIVVASGDLSDDGSPASYAILRDAIEPWATERGAEVLYAMGNHDNRDAFEAVLGSRQRTVELRGFRLISLDTSVPGAGYGSLDDESLGWLAAELAAPAAHGTIVVAHHPPVPAGTALLAALELQNSNVLLQACAGAGVRAILSGHYHHALASEGAGIPVIVAPGIANTTDPLAPRGRERATMGAGFAVIEVPEQGPVRTVFVHAPAEDDGREVFDLDEDEVARIAAQAGVQPA
jgi:3',5'-cyclic AMP phosphodiesterase CpdA